MKKASILGSVFEAMSSTGSAPKTDSAPKVGSVASAIGSIFGTTSGTNSPSPEEGSVASTIRDIFKAAPPPVYEPETPDCYTWNVPPARPRPSPEVIIIETPRPRPTPEVIIIETPRPEPEVIIIEQPTPKKRKVYVESEPARETKTEEVEMEKPHVNKDALYAMSVAAKLLLGVVALGVAITVAPIAGAAAAVATGVATAVTGFVAFHVIDKQVVKRQETGSNIAGGVGSVLRFTVILAIEALLAALGVVASPVVAAAIGIIAPLLLLITVLQLVVGAIRTAIS